MEIVLADLAAPLTYIFDPSRRIFWASILSSLLLASIVVAFQTKKWDPLSQAKALFNRKYWLTKSSGQDVGLLFLNNGIKALLIIPLFGSHLWATIYVGRFLQSTFGDAPTLEVPGVIVGLVYALVFLLFEDGSRFFVHRTMHNVPFLWRLHRVHHSAEILTPLTLFRVHPLESIIYFLRGLLVFGLVSGFFIWLFGRELTFFHILGVDALGFISIWQVQTSVTPIFGSLLAGLRISLLAPPNINFIIARIMDTQILVPTSLFGIELMGL